MTYTTFKERVQKAYSPNITITDDNVMTAYSALPNNKRKRLGLPVGRSILNYHHWYRGSKARMLAFTKECVTKILLPIFKESAQEATLKYINISSIEKD